jgi:hypothetical protein
MMYVPAFLGLTLNVGQAAFAAMADVVQVVSRHLSHRNDLHGRNSLLSTYIQYQAHLPHLDPSLNSHRPSQPPAQNRFGKLALPTAKYGGTVSRITVWAVFRARIC